MKGFEKHRTNFHGPSNLWHNLKMGVRKKRKKTQFFSLPGFLLSFILTSAEFREGILKTAKMFLSLNSSDQIPKSCDLA